MESKWEHFTLKELTCKCGCGKANMDSEFMNKLVALRKHMAVPFRVTSAYRCPEYDAAIGGKGAHVEGRAVDICIYYKNADRMITLSHGFGFTGRGIKQKGELSTRFIHLDDLSPGGDKTRPATWTY